MLLGMPEAAMSAALLSLIEARIIEETPGGWVRVLDRDALHLAACE
jgi:hypothetical protein